MKIGAEPVESRKGEGGGGPRRHAQVMAMTGAGERSRAGARGVACEARAVGAAQEIRALDSRKA
jgi:hypothetical protein